MAGLPDHALVQEERRKSILNVEDLIVTCSGFSFPLQLIPTRTKEIDMVPFCERLSFPISENVAYPLRYLSKEEGVLSVNFSWLSMGFGESRKDRDLPFPDS